MSIYATRWEMKLAIDPPFTIKAGPGETFDWFYTSIYLQEVPRHIGQPSEGYVTDPYADFLPPIVSDYDRYDEVIRTPRAVVIVMRGYEKKDCQRYIEPLLVMSGKEYEEAKFPELLSKIYKRAEELLLRDGKLQSHKWVVRYNESVSESEEW